MPLFLIAAQDRADSPYNQLSDPQSVWAELTELDAAMREAGVFVFSRGLQAPDAAVTFRAEADGAVVRREGPYGDATLAGMWIVDCETADAEAWAARCAETHRCDVELRPFQSHVSDYIEEPA